MMLRMLVTKWLREQAEGHVLNAVRDSLEQSAGSTNREPQPPCEIVIQFASSAEAGGVVDSLSDRVTSYCASQVEHVGNLQSRRVAIAGGVDSQRSHGQAAYTINTIAQFKEKIGDDKFNNEDLEIIDCPAKLVNEVENGYVVTDLE